MIVSSIVDTSQINVKFEDIIGLKNAKQAVSEALIYPSQRPDFFTGIRAPPKGKKFPWKKILYKFFPYKIKILTPQRHPPLRPPRQRKNPPRQSNRRKHEIQILHPQRLHSPPKARRRVRKDPPSFIQSSRDHPTLNNFHRRNRRIPHQTNRRRTAIPKTSKNGVFSLFRRHWKRR